MSAVKTEEFWDQQARVAADVADYATQQVYKAPPTGVRVRDGKVTIGGVDITEYVHLGSLAMVAVGDDPEWQEWGLRLTLVADPANVDL